MGVPYHVGGSYASSIHGVPRQTQDIDLVVNLNGLDGTSSYDIAPSGAGSKVTWTFGYESGSNPLKRCLAMTAA